MTQHLKHLIEGVLLRFGFAPCVTNLIELEGGFEQESESLHNLLVRVECGLVMETVFGC